MKIKSRLFGEQDLCVGYEYSEEHQITLNGKQLGCDLTWGPETMGEDVSKEEERASKVLILLDTLPELDKKVISHFHSSIQKSEDTTIQEYIDYHFREVETQVLEKLETKEPDAKLFLQNLELISVQPVLDKDGSGDEMTLGCDYSIGRNISDYVLAVIMDLNGNIISVDMES